MDPHVILLAQGNVRGLVLDFARCHLAALTPKRNGQCLYFPQETLLDGFTLLPIGTTNTRQSI
jgi:hypothetical protein